MPAPAEAKWGVLSRYGDPTGVWIESGTYLGDTTHYLARHAKHVYSIEPEPKLAELARERFRECSNVSIIEGLSESHLGDLLDTLDGGISLWLDGHYSAGITHQGPVDTPIRMELKAVEERMDRFSELTVLVDDVRCFEPSNPVYATYPSRSWLVAWADHLDLTWTIEHDIFVAQSR